MKNFKYYSILFIVSILTLVSCDREEYLDITPVGRIIPTTLDDYRLMLDGIRSGFGSGARTEGFFRKHTISRFLSDNVKLNLEIFNAVGTTQNDLRAYLFEDAIYAASESDPDWEAYYQHIYVANIILEGLNEIEDSAEKRALEAEAKVHRAYAYFNLVNLYATHYNSSTAATDLGVPIRKGVELTGLDFSRASVQEVYDLIIDDLQFGTTNLEDTQSGGLIFRPSKAAAFSLLSRVYLYQANYNDALTAVNNALDLQSALRDINNDATSMFAPGLRVVQDFTLDPEVIWFKDGGWDFGLTAPADEFINLYESGDIRREWFTTMANHSVIRRRGDLDELVYAARYFVEINSNSDAIATAELYLIRAECNARLGNIGDANSDLNALRINRFTAATYTPVNITDATVLLQFVKDDRRREMAMTADRLFDIKRYNLFDNDGISINRTYDGQTVTVAPNSNNWVLPIGQKYILLNPEIEQNPRD